MQQRSADVRLNTLVKPPRGAGELGVQALQRGVGLAAVVQQQSPGAATDRDGLERVDLVDDDQVAAADQQLLDRHRVPGRPWVLAGRRSTHGSAPGCQASTASSVTAAAGSAQPYASRSYTQAACSSPAGARPAVTSARCCIPSGETSGVTWCGIASAAKSASSVRASVSAIALVGSSTASTSPWRARQQARTSTSTLLPTPVGATKRRSSPASTCSDGPSAPPAPERSRSSRPTTLRR